MNKKTNLITITCLLFSSSIFAKPSIDSVVSDYSQLVYKTYYEAYTKAKRLQNDIDSFLENPSLIGLELARESWKSARAPYGQSEAFRFYNGPIDNDNGPEGLLNAWPLDEVYIDYVVGAPNAGIINNPIEFPVISKALLSSLNELDGEKNISTGYHAIEFLLWGQDLSLTGPGSRSYTDYTTMKNADRRGEYLRVTTDLLLDHLGYLVSQWEPATDNYRKEFETKDKKEALKNILSGIIFMVGDELSGERMYVAWETMGQEDEHSCFSDMTHMDIVWNFKGVENILNQTQVLNLVDDSLAQSIEKKVSLIKQMLTSIPAPFDQAILNEDARALIMSSVEEMEYLTEELVEASRKLNVPVQW